VVLGWTLLDVAGKPGKKRPLVEITEIGMIGEVSEAAESGNEEEWRAGFWLLTIEKFSHRKIFNIQAQSRKNAVWKGREWMA
jgi:hypothetical protein